MNLQSHHEPDDELLSAYLDDELTADERALVERRLATDPAARQTLEQLRSASQSLRELPRESVPVDLRDAVVQRIEAGRDSRATGTSFLAERTSPALSVGRTRRGWLWAAAAVAAAMLIAVFLPDQSEDRVPNLARRDQETRTENGPRSMGRGELKPSDPAAAEPLATVTRSAEIESLPATAGDDLAARGSDAAGAKRDPSPEISLYSATPHVERRNGSPPAAAALPLDTAGAPDAPSAPPATPSAAGIAGAPAPAASESDPLDNASATPDVVVDVVLDRAAFQSGAFDRLLAKHGIDTEPVAAVPADGALADRYAGAPASAPAPAAEAATEPARSAAGTVANQRELHEKLDATDVEVVLVDAPASAIFACMNDLQTDSADVLGVAVEPLADKAKSSASDPSHAYWYDQLSSYERGQTPVAKDVAAGRYFRGEQAKALEPGAAGALDAAPLAGAAPGQSRSDAVAPVAAAPTEPAGRASARGRARKLTPALRALERESAASQQNTSEAVEIVEKAAEAKALPARPAQPGDRRQVLFVLRPGDRPAASLDGANTPE